MPTNSENLTKIGPVHLDITSLQGTVKNKNYKPAGDGRRYVACDVEPAPILPAPIDTLYVKTS